MTIKFCHTDKLEAKRNVNKMPDYKQIKNAIIAVQNSTPTQKVYYCELTDFKNKFLHVIAMYSNSRSQLLTCFAGDMPNKHDKETCISRYSGHMSQRRQLRLLVYFNVTIEIYSLSVGMVYIHHW